MTDNVTVLPDTIEARTADPQVPDFDTNYIESGLVLSADFDAGLLAVSQGKCLHSYDGDLYYASKIERRTGERRLSIPAGTSDVWYDFDAAEIVIGSDPGEPSLRIGSVDAAAETVDNSINRDRDISAGSLTAETQDITDGRVIRVEGANGRWVETFDPDEYITDHAALNAARDAIKSTGQGGVIKLGAYTYDLNGPFYLDDHGIKLSGVFIRETPDPSEDPTDQIDDINTVKGTTLRQNQAGAHGILVRHEEADTILFDGAIEDLSVTWEDSINRSDTGDGIHISPGDSWDFRVRSATKLDIDNVHIHGNDGNHYGINIEAAQSVKTDEVYVEGGPIFREASPDQPTGNSNHRYIYGVNDVQEGTEPLFNIRGDLNFNLYHYLEVIVRGYDSPRDSYAAQISPNGNVNDCWFGIFDIEGSAGNNGNNVGEIDNIVSTGIGLGNPFGTGQYVMKNGGLFLANDGSNPEYTALGIKEGNTGAGGDWQRLRTGTQRWKSAMDGDPSNPTVAGTSSPGPSFSDGKVALRLPDPGTVSEGDIYTFYVNFDLVADTGTFNSFLDMDIVTHNGNGMGVQLASNCNDQNVAGEVQIDAKVTGSTNPFPVDLVAELELK